jgi:hypothetical protein
MTPDSVRLIRVSVVLHITPAARSHADEMRALSHQTRSRFIENLIWERWDKTHPIGCKHEHVTPWGRGDEVTLRCDTCGMAVQP